MTAPAVAPVTKQLSQQQVNEYADASDDHNPIHVDEAFAAASPLGGTIAHGMLVLATISEMMAASLGEAWLTNGKLKVRFRAPARTADTVTASAKALTASAKALTASATPQESADGAAYRYAVECRNQDGEVLISGTAQVAAGG
ncbi:MAG: MaoC family dehydratase [Chloroflexi bacterium]|nr:MaoC family dehydratase [Chloroflexota bacterium]MCH8008642.1 MaoC family dehydratase [Chloroflexota bacterium]